MSLLQLLPMEEQLSAFQRVSMSIHLPAQSLYITLTISKHTLSTSLDLFAFILQASFLFSFMVFQIYLLLRSLSLLLSLLNLICTREIICLAVFTDFDLIKHVLFQIPSFLFYLRKFFIPKSPSYFPHFIWYNILL